MLSVSSDEYVLSSLTSFHLEKDLLFAISSYPRTPPSGITISILSKSRQDTSYSVHFIVGASFVKKKHLHHCLLSTIFTNPSGTVAPVGSFIDLSENHISLTTHSSSVCAHFRTSASRNLHAPLLSFSCCNAEFA